MQGQYTVLPAGDGLAEIVAPVASKLSRYASSLPPNSGPSARSFPLSLSVQAGAT